MFTTWRRGREIVTRRRELEEGSLRAFIDALHAMDPPLLRVSGTGVFLNRGKETAPLAMRANVQHNRVLHAHVVILAIETAPVPHIPPGERIVIDELGYRDDGITHVTATFGYMDRPRVPAILRRLETMDLEAPLEVDTASYFLSKIDLRPGRSPPCRAGASGSSSPRRRSRPTPPSTSSSRASRQ